MGNEWKEVTLDKVYDFRSGLSKPRSEFGSGYKFLSFKDVFYNYFVPDELTELVNSTGAERENCSVKRGDVFLTRTSETFDELGMSSVALRDYENATFNGFCKRLRPIDNSVIVPEYAGYYFRSLRFRRSVTAMSSMSTRASLNNEILGKLKIVIPSKEEQKKIGFILKAFDDKIALNRRQNDTLEHIAQALFQSWFVDFDPVIDKALAAGKPIPEPLQARAERRRAMGDRRKPLPAEIQGLFPDGFGYDEEFGWVPEGWEVVDFRKVYQIFDSKRIPLSKKQRQERQGTYPYYGATSQMDSVDDYIFDGTYVLVGEDGSVIDDSGFPITQYVWGKFWVNNHAHVLKGNSPISEETILLFLKKTNVQAFVTGAVQPKINQKNLGSIKFLRATDLVHNTFSSMIKVFFDKIKLQSEELTLLSQLRDTLLPKLISGELRVSELMVNE